MISCDRHGQQKYSQTPIRNPKLRAQASHTRSLLCPRRGAPSMWVNTMLPKLQEFYFDHAVPLKYTLEWVAVWFALSHQTNHGWLSSNYCLERCASRRLMRGMSAGIMSTFITFNSVHDIHSARLDLLDGGGHVSSNARWQHPLQWPALLLRRDAEQHHHGSNLASADELLGQHLRVSQLWSSWGCHKPTCLLLPFLAECFCSPLILSQCSVITTNLFFLTGTVMSCRVLLSTLFLLRMQ